MLRFDFQAIAVNVHDPDPFADCRGAAARRPFAVAHSDPAAIGIDRLDDDDHSAKEPRASVIEEGIGAVIVTRSIKASAADARGEERKDREQPS